MSGIKGFGGNKAEPGSQPSRSGQKSGKSFGIETASLDI